MVQQTARVVIVDEFTGRLMTGRRWSDGLHQAVEAKEGVPIQSENQTLASITFQNYFRMYGKLAGMTGTADTEAYEFQEIYGLETVVIPPNKPTIRKDELDLVYKTGAREVRRGDRGHPRLPRARPAGAGRHDLDRELRADLRPARRRPSCRTRCSTPSSTRARPRSSPRPGGPGVITIATNMAGRGTDIVLGGNVEKQVKIIEADEAIAAGGQGARGRRSCTTSGRGLHDAVKAQGGLRIIATERHESRRIDNQLRGRSGRQGDPGSSRFYLSPRRPADAHLRRRPRARRSWTG